MGPAEFEAAGLYDPAASDAADRLVLLEWLVAHGATLDRLVAASGERMGLGRLAADLALHTSNAMNLAEVAERAGLTPARVQEIRFGAGLPPIDPAERVFLDGDARGFTAFAAGEQLFGTDATRQFSRVMGASLARIAEALISVFRMTVEAPIRQAQGSELAMVEANWRGIEVLHVVPVALEALFRGHFDLAMRRLRQAEWRGSFDVATFAVGFVDLVGFTPLSRGLDPPALTALVERFEDTAHDVATARDGRVVKLMGDEVMFVAVDPAAACDIALTLMERLCSDSTTTPRGGLAYGDMLPRGGDYYGPTVNLASRIAEQAVPNELLVTPEVAQLAQRPGLSFERAGKRMLKGFDAPVALMTVERSRS